MIQLSDVVDWKKWFLNVVFKKMWKLAGADYLISEMRHNEINQQKSTLFENKCLAKMSQLNFGTFRQFLSYLN